MKNLFDKAKGVAGTMANATKSAIDKGPSAGDVKRTADFLVDTTTKAASEISRLGKDALKTDLAKDAAAGAAIGAAIAVPIPIIGPITGAVVGAGLGVYKNIRQGPASPEPLEALDRPQDVHVAEVSASPPPPIDKFEELNKLHELMVKGVLTEAEFAAEKRKILDR